ncbi:hypothetical protein ACIA8C_20120 [Nocardia sp. NPDC051321]|uniref:hypothetical protein n=1 Tax=Nocardia sp. NPDC051321 TaxID=3364323 RepID=UPI0037B113F7
MYDMVSDERQLDPALEKWLRDTLDEKGFRLFRDRPLMAMTLLQNHDAMSRMPGKVLSAWRRLIVEMRREVDQSEVCFIDVALRNEMTWQDIADGLGLPSVEAAKERRVKLDEELDRMHPGNNPTPWLP